MRTDGFVAFAAVVTLALYAVMVWVDHRHRPVSAAWRRVYRVARHLNVPWVVGVGGYAAWRIAATYWE